MERCRVAIVIPAYNESNTIRSVVESVVEYGQPIVVDDGSTDSTSIKAVEAGAIVVKHDHNLGYEEALNSGFSEASKRDFSAIITFDADGQHTSSVLGVYIDKLSNNSIDLVLGVRPYPARLSEWIFKAYTNFKFGWKDPLCGMKGYSMNLYRDLGVFDTIKSVGTELALYAIKNNFNYSQVKIDIAKRKDSPRFSSRMKSNFFILRALFRIIKKYERY